MVSNLNLPTTQLLEGALFIKSNGLVAFTADQSLGGFKLTNIGDAVGSQDAVNLRTAQALINGVAIKPSVRLVAVANLALTGLQTVDSVALAASDRILLTAQTTGSQNGPWVAASGAWTRPSDWAAASTQKAGILILVAEGGVYKDTKWLGITDGSVIVDTTSTVWIQDMSGITYINGTGLSLTGNTFAVKYSNGITVDGTSSLIVQANGTSLNVSATGVKIADGTAAQVMMANGTGLATFTAFTGDVTVSATGSTAVNTSIASGFLKYTSNVYNESVVGSVNGTNTAFSIAFTPAVSSLELFYNGQLLEPGTGNDYTISGVAITMLFAPVAGDKLRAYYIK